MISRLFGIYVFLGALTALWQSFWGRLQYESIAYIIGRCLLWPAVWFPRVGEVLGALVFIVLIVAFVAGRKG